MPRRPQTYAERTYASPHWIVRFPHQRRYAEMAGLVRRLQPHSILDYGSGAGEFLIGLFTDGTAPPTATAVAYETMLSPSTLADLETNLAAGNVGGRVTMASRAEHLAGPFDLVLCMGVLEHMTLTARHEFYDTMDRVLAPGGTIAIDVPVEIGPAVVLKNLVRRTLKRDTRQYRLGELIRIGLGGRVFDPQRFTPTPVQDVFIFHHGFDHRLLREELASRFDVIDQRKTPLNWLPVACNQEVILLLTARS